MTTRARHGIAAALLALAGCGGGGGGVDSTPTPTPTPTPPPTVTVSTYETTEYQQSSATSFAGAAYAWVDGDFGNGVKIGVVDTGVYPNLPDLAGRITAANVAGGGSTDDEDGHGTMVALVAAAARNNAGIVGVAPSAQIVMERADTPGTCASSDGCSFRDDDIARGIDAAVSAHAQIVNLSLGGSSPSADVTAAVRRAAAAGLVIVVSAGNDADDADSENDPAQPDPFAAGIRDAGGANVIIAGSVDEAGVISTFSNRAGAQAAGYLTALGEDVCCVYNRDGTLKTTTDTTGSYVYVVSGTSFSAPAIAGAAALLKQAFPNLGGADIVKLLLDRARDAGDPGTDTTYGAGILDIARAFAPQGTLSLADGVKAVPIADMAVTASSAMGDAASRAPALGAVALDTYGRAYHVDLARGLHGAAARPSLGLSLAAPLAEVGGSDGPVSLALSLDRGRGALDQPWLGALRLDAADTRGAAVLAGRVVARLAPGTRLAIGYAQGSDGLAAQVIGAAGNDGRPAFLVARAPGDDLGFATAGALSFALRRAVGRWGVTLSGESGAGYVARSRIAAPTPPTARDPTYTRIALGLDRSWGPVSTTLAAGWLAERHSVLGASFDAGFGARGADSLLVDLDFGWRFASRWRMGATWREGLTRARAGGLIAAGSAMTSNAWALDLARAGVFARGDSLGFRVSQPLRVGAGGLGLVLPVGYDYATLAATEATVRLPLAPRGREVAAELAWRGPLWGGAASASVFRRTDPGNVAARPEDIGAALTWRTGF